MKKLTVIDYNMGNLYSIKNALEYLKIEYELTDNLELIENSKFILLPGVGHFEQAMKNLKEKKIDIALKKAIFNKANLLGICLGMQLLFDSSEETDSSSAINGLGLIPGNVLKFKENKNIKVPHIGWNSINMINKKLSLFKNISNFSDFYFVHSYYLSCPNKYILTTTIHDINFVSSVQNGNIFGVQFHPEKSHYQGLEILKNFMELEC